MIINKSSQESHIDDVMHLSLIKLTKHRLPWLFLGLMGGILAANIVGSFEKVLSKHITLAAFIPLMVYMSDAVGTQMEAFVIRDFAIHPRIKFIKYLLKHLIVTSYIAAILGLSLFAFSYATGRDPRISVVLTLSLVISIISSVITGLILPLIFKKFRYDPANASGPIATIIQDITSVTVYFSIASWLL